METQKRIDEIQESIKLDTEALEALTELEDCAEQWDKKLINKTFYKAFPALLHSNEYREWYKYEYYPLDIYDWHKDERHGGYQYKVYLSRDRYMYVKSRETKDLLQALKDTRKELEESTKRYEDIIVSLGEVDEKQLFSDLQAVFKKHNFTDQNYSIWDNALKDFDLSGYSLLKK